MSRALCISGEYIDAVCTQGHLAVPDMAQLNSTSTGGTTSSQTKEPLDSIALEALLPLS